ncbi:hypothetical protein ABB37_06725 [Leptomonas pyrrhocoris]|uniref:Uncharacterized protein n=1 Tax=Leptomonas pyrrhocoris TaxID=157538 RepID=A0A0M9FX89_LEPPY|nr:hypothetical protein ABB37_06725 [Leptomonas pyrrhocoris]KPA77955.1 hypothetical protein ABB37_06725 [Leptomonas pyrrhocoris]|eukprot:XP_015656394.1 hypothetical protein ABB37_06725 [Leptomonas pyrrhocoris]
MEDALKRAIEDAVVRDACDGSCFLALHPIYSSPPYLCFRVGLCRASVVLLSFVLLACALLGHVLPCCQTAYGVTQWYVWARAWLNGQELPYLDRREDVLLLRCTAAGFVLAGLAVCVTSIELSRAWSCAESARTREEVDNRCLREVYARQLMSMTSSAGTCDGTSSDDVDVRMAQAVRSRNTTTGNHGQVICIPFEEREQQRRCALNRTATIALICLLCAALFSALTVLLLWLDYSLVVRQREEAEARLAPGFTCFVASGACGLVSVAFLLISTLSQGCLFRGSAAVPCCLLMRVSDSVLSAGTSGASSGHDSDVRLSRVATTTPDRQNAKEGGSEEDTKAPHRPHLSLSANLHSAASAADHDKMTLRTSPASAELHRSTAVPPSGLEKVVRRSRRRRE